MFKILTSVIFALSLFTPQYIVPVLTGTTQANGSCVANQACITNVSGTLTTDSTITITGTDLLNPVTTGYSTDITGGKGSFEGASYTADGFAADSGSPAAGSSFGYSTSTKLVGNKSFFSTTVVTGYVSGGCCGAGAAGIQTTALTPDLWWSVYFSLHPNANGFATQYQKFLMTGGTPQWYVDFSGGDGTHYSTIKAIYNGTSTDFTSRPYGISQYENDRWYWFKCHWRKSTGGGSLYQCWIDDSQVINIIPGAGNDPANLDWVMIGLINAAGPDGSNWDATAYYDQLVYADRDHLAYSKIEIANGSNYATATKVWQEPRTLSSETSIQFKYNLTYGTQSVTCSPTCYIFVTNNAGERSPGFAITP